MKNKEFKILVYKKDAAIGKHFLNYIIVKICKRDVYRWKSWECKVTGRAMPSGVYDSVIVRLKLVDTSCK